MVRHPWCFSHNSQQLVFATQGLAAVQRGRPERNRTAHPHCSSAVARDSVSNPKERVHQHARFGTHTVSPFASILRRAASNAAEPRCRGAAQVRSRDAAPLVQTSRAFGRFNETGSYVALFRLSVAGCSRIGSICRPFEPASLAYALQLFPLSCLAFTG